MATWVRLGTGTAPTATNADLTGEYALDNATAPGDFDPAAVTSIRTEWTITGSGFNDDSWDNVAGVAVVAGVTDTEVSQHLATGGTGLQNESEASDDTDSTGIPTGLTTADWEAAYVRGNGTVTPLEWCLWVKDKGPDGSTLTVSALTVTITYTPAVSGTDYTETSTDALGLTDSTPHVLDAARSVTDALGLSDTTARVWDAVRQSTDPLGLTDTVVSARQIRRTITDALGVSDDVADVLFSQHLETATDALGLTDAVARVVAAARTITDALGLSDDVQTAVAAARAVTESLGITDNVASARQIKRTVTDSLGLSDAVADALSRTESATDPLGLTDVIAHALAAARTITDTTGITDNVATVRVIKRTITDSLGLADTVTSDSGGATNYQRTITDTFGITDSVTRTLDFEPGPKVGPFLTMRFYRHPAGHLIKVRTGKPIVPVGWSPTEGFEQLTAKLKVPIIHDTKSLIDRAVAEAWKANSTADAATLKTVLENAAINAGYEYA